MPAAILHRDVWHALVPTIRLAWPVIMAELGWMFMGVVDTIMVGWFAPEAIGAVGLGGIVFFTVAVFGMGLLLGLDTFVSQAYGAGTLHECHRWLRAGVHLACIATAPVMLLAFGLVAAMPLFKWHPTVQALTAPYLSALAWGSLPLLLYAAFRRYLQAIGIVRPVMMTLLAANGVNALFNWLLIFGHLGFPALGVTGSAWATVIARVFMATCLLAVIVRHEAPIGSACPTSRFSDRVGSCVASAPAGRASRHADHRRGRCVWRGGGAGRSHRSSVARRAPGRAEHRERDVHGAAGARFRRSGARRARRWPEGFVRRAAAGWAAIAHRRRVHDRVGDSVSGGAARPRRACSPGTRPCSPRASRS